GVAYLVAIDDADVGADAGVLVDDGGLDHRVLADAEARRAAAEVLFLFGLRLEAVGADDDGVADDGVLARHGAKAGGAVLDLGSGLDDAAVGDQAVVEARVDDTRRRQITHARVDDAVRRVEIERRLVGGQRQIGFVIGLYRAHVFPVIVEQERLDVVGLDAARKNLLAEIRGQRRRVQQVDECFARKDIYAHAGEKLAAVAADPLLADPFGRRPPRLQLFLCLGLFDEADDAARFIEADDAELGGLFRRHR